MYIILFIFWIKQNTWQKKKIINMRIISLYHKKQSEFNKTEGVFFVILLITSSFSLSFSLNIYWTNINWYRRIYILDKSRWLTNYNYIFNNISFIYTYYGEQKQQQTYYYILLWEYTYLLIPFNFRLMLQYIFSKWQFIFLNQLTDTPQHYNNNNKKYWETKIYIK